MVGIIHLFIDIKVNNLVALGTDSHVTVFFSASFLDAHWSNFGLLELRCAPFQDTVVSSFASTSLFIFGSLKLEEIQNIISDGDESKPVWQNLFKSGPVIHLCAFFDEATWVNMLDNCHDFDDKEVSHIGTADKVVIFKETKWFEVLWSHYVVNKPWRLFLNPIKIWKSHHLFRILTMVVKDTFSANHELWWISWQELNLTDDGVKRSGAHSFANL